MNSLKDFFKKVQAIKHKPVAAVNRHPINAVISRFGGRRDVSYLKVLLSVANTAWPQLIERYLDARVVWGVVVGAGIGGPTSDPVSSYLYGGYHAWPLYSDEEVTTDIQVAELIRTLQYGLNALIEQPYFSKTTTLFEFLKIKAGEKWVARVQGLNKLSRPAEIRPNDPVGETEASLSRYVPLSSHIIREGHFWVKDVILHPDPTKVDIDNPGEIISSILFAAWGIIGEATDTYISGILCGIFPTLCMGQNTRTDKLIRLTSRINREFEISHHITVSDGSSQNLWYGCRDILRVDDRARVAAMRCQQLSDSLGSIWIGVFGRRMKFFGLSSLILVSTAVAFFPHAAWSQFFDINQQPYTAESLKLQDYPLIEWLLFVECVADLVQLNFTTTQFKNASDEQKIAYLIETFQAIRPRGSFPEWRAQGPICLHQLHLALENPYMMYTGVPGRTSEMGDLAYYALMLLRDLGKQTSLETYHNAFHKYAKRPLEVEQLVNWYKKVTATLPGGRGILEMQTTELSNIISYFTSEDDFGPMVEEQVARRLVTATRVMREFVEPPAPETPGRIGPSTRMSTQKEKPPKTKRAREESGSSTEVPAEDTLSITP